MELNEQEVGMMSSGTLGGLMTSMHVDVNDESGKLLPEGSLEKMDRYGRLVAQLAARALEQAKPVALAPFEVRSRSPNPTCTGSWDA